jgi:hypothetical protein
VTFDDELEGSETFHESDSSEVEGDSEVYQTYQTHRFRHDVFKRNCDLSENKPSFPEFMRYAASISWLPIHDESWKYQNGEKTEPIESDQPTFNNDKDSKSYPEMTSLNLETDTDSLILMQHNILFQNQKIAGKHFVATYPQSADILFHPRIRKAKVHSKTEDGFDSMTQMRTKKCFATVDLLAPKIWIIWKIPLIIKNHMLELFVKHKINHSHFLCLQ